MRYVLIFLCLIGTYSFVFAAQGQEAIHGKMSVESAPLSDPVPNSPPVVFFTIEGNSAKTIFTRMVNPKIYKNACGESGVIMKELGDLICFKHKKNYTCNFGLGLSDGKSQFGYTC